MNKNDISPAHMQNIFLSARDGYLNTFEYVTDDEYDAMITDYFKTHYTAKEMDDDLPLDECCLAVRKAYEPLFHLDCHIHENKRDLENLKNELFDTYEKLTESRYGEWDGDAAVVKKAIDFIGELIKACKDEDD